MWKDNYGYDYAICDYLIDMEDKKSLNLNRPIYLHCFINDSDIDKCKDVDI